MERTWIRKQKLKELVEMYGECITFPQRNVTKFIYKERMYDIRFDEIKFLNEFVKDLLPKPKTNIYIERK